MSRVGRSDVLRPLARLLRLTGTKTSPAEVDIGRPLTPTIDLGIWAGRLGSLIISEPFTVATGGTGVAAFSTRDMTNLRANTAIAAAMRNVGLQDDFDFWLMDVECAVTAATSADFQEAAIGVLDPQTGSDFIESTQRSRLIGRGNSTVPAFESGGSLPVIFTTTVNSESPFLHLGNKLPRRIEQALFLSQDDGTGIVNVLWSPIYALTPRGVIPHL